MTQRMGFLLLDDFALMSCAAAIEPLRAANLLAGQPLYDLTFLSVKGGPAAASVGAVFDTVSIDAETVPFDIVFVVAGGNPMASKYPEAARFLRQLDRRGVALGGISGGGVILAQSGLMLGRRFTVHWQHFDALREVSPGHLMERRLFVIDRDRFTCAGGSAPLDMMHALITAQHGIALAQKVADWFIHTRIREAGDPQKSGTAERYQLHHPVLVTTVDMMETHIADPLTVEQLATLADMSPRHLQRLFRDRMGLSLIRFYRDLRLDKARDLLSQTGLPILEVALATGFANGAHFARAFRDKFGTRPSTLRPTGIADQAGSAENSGLTSTWTSNCGQEPGQERHGRNGIQARSPQGPRQTGKEP